MKRNHIIGLAIIFMIAMVSIGAVLSFRGQADTTNTCPNAGNCIRNGTCDGNCDKSNCIGECPNKTAQQKQTRTCGRTCRG